MENFFFLEFATVGDDDWCFWFSGISSRSLDFLDQVHATGDLTEHNVSLVQPRAHHSGDEELWGKEGESEGGGRGCCECVLVYEKGEGWGEGGWRGGLV